MCSVLTRKGLQASFPPHKVSVLCSCWILFAPQTNFDGRIYSLKLVCGPRYPNEPPEVTFITRVNLPCVNPRDGEVSALSSFGQTKLIFCFTDLASLHFSFLKKMCGWGGLHVLPQVYKFSCFLLIFAGIKFCG